MLQMGLKYPTTHLPNIDLYYLGIKKCFPFQTSMMIGVAIAPSIDGPFEVVVDEPFFGLIKWVKQKILFSGKMKQVII